MGMQARTRSVIVIFGSFYLHNLSVGFATSFGVIYKELVIVFEVGEGSIGWIPSLFTGLVLGTGIITGVLVSKFGVCISTVVGSLLMTIGMVASAFVPSPYLLYLTYGVIGGCGASLLLIAGVGNINEEFDERRTLAMGVASTGAAVGNIVLPLFTLWCIETYSWRGSFLLLGGLCLQGVVVGLLFYNGKRKDAKQTVLNTGKTEVLAEAPCKRCLKVFNFFNWRFICFVVASTFGVIGYLIPFNLIYSMMTSKGQTKAYSSLTLSLSGAGSISSRVLIGFAGDYRCLHRIYYFIFAMTLCGIINVACLHLTVYWQFFVYGFLYGVGTGIFGCLLSIITVDLVGVEHFGPAYGFLITMQGLGSSIGTPSGGWLFEATGSYNSSFYFAAACFLVCALLSFIIPVSLYCKPCFRRRYNVTNNDLDISVIQREVYTRTNDHSSSMLQVRF